jgi:hypothetical protein
MQESFTNKIKETEFTTNNNSENNNKKLQLSKSESGLKILKGKEKLMRIDKHRLGSKKEKLSKKKRTRSKDNKEFKKKKEKGRRNLKLNGKKTGFAEQTQQEFKKLIVKPG